MNIRKELNNWDGKSADDIRLIYTQYHQEQSFISELIRLIKDTSHQKGATWLLKSHVSEVGHIDSGTATKIYALLTKLDNWESKLHILQSIPGMPIEKSVKISVEIFLRECLSDSNKFVRAWTYHGFFELASQYPEYMEETRLFFDMAMRDEAPSVKARIRNIYKKL